MKERRGRDERGRRDERVGRGKEGSEGGGERWRDEGKGRGRDEGKERGRDEGKERGRDERGGRGKREERICRENGKRVIIIVVWCLSHSPKVSSGSKRAFTF